jgi:hypothetical protein
MSTREVSAVIFFALTRPASPQRQSFDRGPNRKTEIKIKGTLQRCALGEELSPKEAAGQEKHTPAALEEVRQCCADFVRGRCALSPHLCRN